MIGLEIAKRLVWIRPWLYVHTSPHGHPIPILLLDTDLDQNGEEDRKMTHYLYGGDDIYRLKQELILGLGGIRLLQALGFHIHTHHLNEGTPPSLPSTSSIAIAFRLKTCDLASHDTT